jgi:hypothetical protein
MKRERSAVIRIELTQEEHDLQIEVLDEFLSDLRMEIADTDSADYKDGLRHEKAVIIDLIAKIKEAK